MDEHYSDEDGPPSFEDQIRIAKTQGFLWGIVVKIGFDLILWASTHTHLTWSVT